MDAERLDILALDSQKLHSDMDQLLQDIPVLELISTSTPDITAAKRLDKLVLESQKLLTEAERLASEGDPLLWDLSFEMVDLSESEAMTPFVLESRKQLLEAQRLNLAIDQLLHFPAFKPLSTATSHLPRAERLEKLRLEVGKLFSDVRQLVLDFPDLMSKPASASSIPFDNQTERVDRLVREAWRVRSEINQVQHDFPALRVNLASRFDITINEGNPWKIHGHFKWYSNSTRPDTIRRIRDHLVVVQQAPIVQLKKRVDEMHDEVFLMGVALRVVDPELAKSEQRELIANLDKMIKGLKEIKAGVGAVEP
ncbi:hypothetical protein FAVG1_08284 [Fusarium avenaceum]|nr:hypothetical protein FAVG1_08284 [Fusarium avenaceum]